MEELESAMIVFSKIIIKSSKMTKAELKELIRKYSDDSESFENLVFEIGCDLLAEQYERIISDETT